jgi:NACalpha-BTF3-like transcription factor
MKKKVKGQLSKLSHITESDIKVLMHRLSITRNEAMRRLLNRAVRS